MKHLFENGSLSVDLSEFLVGNEGKKVIARIGMHLSGHEPLPGGDFPVTADNFSISVGELSIGDRAKVTVLVDEEEVAVQRFMVDENGNCVEVEAPASTEVVAPPVEENETEEDNTPAADVNDKTEDVTDSSKEKTEE